MTRAGPAPRAFSLLLLLLASEVRAQSTLARGFHPASPPDMAAAGTVIETITVTSQGACAARALFRNALGFNLQREPAEDGTRSCQITNTITGCYSVNLESRPGWDYYQVGRQGQNERVPYRSSGFTIGTSVSSPGAYPPVASAADPDYRWGVDCNGPATVAERQCSQYLLTGIYNAESTVSDLDIVRCYT